MKGLSGKEKCIWLVLAAAVFAAAGYSLERTVIHGTLSWIVIQPRYAEMVFELALLFFLFVLVGRFARNPRARVIGMMVVASVFLWLHVILLPILASGFYLIYVCMAGAQIREWLHCMGRRSGDGENAAWKEEISGRMAVNPGRDFLVGSLAVICLFCLMSALGIGSIPQLCAAVGVTAFLIILIQLCSGRNVYPLALLRAVVRQTAGGSLRSPSESRWSAPRILGTALVLTVFCMQAGRMNIAVDYDTMWYGARAAYILDNGRGIYENLGTVGVVYTYSKGWEILTLPLSVLPSYSFLISASWWMAAGVLWAVCNIAGSFMNRRMAALLTVFLATVPGILNMTLSAKTDMATLLVQLLMIREILRVVDAAPLTGTVFPERRSAPMTALSYSLAAFLLSWTFKPTALVFSTAVYGMSGLYLLRIRGIPRHCPGQERAEATGVVLLAFAALTAVWARTLILTGFPVTSVFTSIFARMGFHARYPFLTKPVPDSGAGLDPIGQLSHLAARLYGFLLNPDVSEDFSHVIVAWGGPVFWLVFCAAAAWLLLGKKRRERMEKVMDGWLTAVCLPFLVVNIVSLYLLQALDGNYFMLLYVLLALAGFRLFARLGKAAVRKGFLCLAVPLMVFSVVFMTVTDWSWSLGLSPVNPINRGYYDHRELRHTEMAAEGKGTIWAILAQDPRNRVIVLGDHPRDLAFPCSAQSYTDIVGSDGNVELVKYMDGFVEFMEYAKTDYIFMNGSWVGDRTRAWELVYYLIEYGYLVPVHYELDNMLAEVCLDGELTQESEARSEEFLHWKNLCLGM